MTSESRAAPPTVPPRSVIHPVRPLQSLAAAQGTVYVTTGLWPIASMRTFEAVTGPKRDHWLVKTVGLLAAVIGSVLLSGARRPDRQTALLGASSAAAFATVDVVYVARGRISRVYLLDALLELAFVAGWLAALTGRTRRRARD